VTLYQQAEVVCSAHHCDGKRKMAGFLLQDVPVDDARREAKILLSEAEALKV